MKIKKLELNNFRKHRKLSIDFSKGINCIIGRNASGKSTIIRALNWVINNKPSGISIISWGKKQASAQLTVFDKNNTYKIKRVRSKTSKNEYILNGKEFKSFGTAVPEEIENVFNTSELNFQGQHDAPFWFSNSAGEISKRLNAIICLDVMDNLQAKIHKKTYQEKTKLNIHEKNITDLNGNLSKYKNIKTLKIKMQALEQAYKIYTKTHDEVETLNYNIDNYFKFNQRIQEYKQDVLKCQNLANKLQKVIELLQLYQDLKKKTDTLKHQICTYKQYKAQSKVDAPKLDNIKKALQELTKTAEQANKLDNEINKIKTINNKIKIYQKNIDEINKEINKLCKGVCPICKKPLK
jgi:DNA repair protein SbcC/Rad50